MANMDKLKTAVSHYCAVIGENPLLVQGAGGNVSWKDNGTLWIKASGTWLANATRENIFVPVDLDDLRNALALGNFAAKPKLARASNSKPSIETLLHALMPHRVVVHLHAIDVLAHLVRVNCHQRVAQLMGDRVRWAMVDYFKPGAELAHAVCNALKAQPHAQVVFMKNHGIVAGGNDIEEISHSLAIVISLLNTTGTTRTAVNIAGPPDAAINGYVPIADPTLHQLACDAQLYTRLNTDWALYPDHVVFLGAVAQRYETLDQLRAAPPVQDVGAPAFVRDTGVYVSTLFGKARMAQLRCYYDVLARQPDDMQLESITPDQVHDLLAREDEKYRIKLARE